MDELETKGFCILDDVFTLAEINEFKKRYKECEDNVHEICKKYPAVPYDFVQLFEKETIIKMRSYCNNSIIETAKGRYDVRTEKVNELFRMVPENPTIARLINSCLQRRYICDIGILLTNSHGNDGLWHRDTYNLNGPSNPDGSYDDSPVIQLKPFYYTCLIPLNDITEENGRTEFMVGSHKCTYADCKNTDRVKHDVKAGSVVVFDGRLFHRACAHPSDRPRQMIYLVFHRDWYVDV